MAGAERSAPVSVCAAGEGWLVATNCGGSLGWLSLDDNLSRGDTAVPLYTYVMSYKGRTKVSQHRHSNYTGFLITPISRAFPSLKPAFGDLIRMRPEPLQNAEHTWACSKEISGEDFTLHVVETRC